MIRDVLLYVAKCYCSGSLRFCSGSLQEIITEWFLCSLFCWWLLAVRIHRVDHFSWNHGSRWSQEEKRRRQGVGILLLIDATEYFLASDYLRKGDGCSIFFFLVHLRGRWCYVRSRAELCKQLVHVILHRLSNCLSFCVLYCCSCLYHAFLFVLSASWSFVVESNKICFHFIVSRVTCHHRLLLSSIKSDMSSQTFTLQCHFAHVYI